MKIVVACFVQQRAEQSGQPAQVNRVVRVQSVKAADSVDNSRLFDSLTPGSVSVDLTGVSAEILAAFSGGGQVTVTLDTSN